MTIFLQKIASYFKIWLTILQAFSKASIFFYCLLLLMVITLKIFFPQYIFLINLAESLILSIIFGACFLHLKKNNFFQFLYLNRNSLFFSFEVLLFLTPIIIVLSIYDIQGFFLNKEQTKNYYLSSILLVFEMLCMLICWFKKYILAHLLITVLNPEDLIKLFFSQNINTENIMHLTNSNITLKYFISSIIIELLFVVYAIRQKNINTRK